MNHVNQFIKAMGPNVSQPPAALPPSNAAYSVSDDDPWLGFDASIDPRLEDAKRAVAEFANSERLGLVLAGDYGCGKTHLARVVRAHFGNDPLSCLLVSEPDLTAAIQATYGPDNSSTEQAVIGRYRRCRVLILDDVGTYHKSKKSPEAAENAQSWLHSIYWRILDWRADRNLPVLVTTNCTLVQLGEWIGGRAFSRLGGMLGSETGYVDLFGVPDYRLRAWRGGR